ncbi:MAG: hypothetical protein L3K15_08525 [Thermoplasmata archaeon]|nr:hypothetical protein [Thermoplasmata archaeon]
MQSGPARDGRSARRSRVPCPKCGVLLEFSRIRMHLREAHQVGAAELETRILNARKDAIRATRGGRR